jgi:hypothetical protein
VKIERAQAGHTSGRRPNELAEVRNAYHVRAKSTQERRHLGCVYVLAFPHTQVQLLCGCRYRRPAQLSAAPGLARRLGNHSNNLVVAG